MELLPLASEDTSWNGADSRRQLSDFATREEGSVVSVDWDEYRKGFLEQSGPADDVRSYHFPYVYVQDGELVAVPRALEAAVYVVPEDSQAREVVATYFEKAGKPIPCTSGSESL